MANENERSIFRKIEYLRSRGVSDNHPEMLKARIRLRDFLEESNKNVKKLPKKLIPKLTSIKTVAVNYETLKQRSKNFHGIDGDMQKYVLLGVIFAISAILYRLLYPTPVSKL